jgi:chorismate synthase
LHRERRSADRVGNEALIRTTGRHDPCGGIRAVPVGEAMLAYIRLTPRFARCQAPARLF